MATNFLRKCLLGVLLRALAPALLVAALASPASAQQKADSDEGDAVILVASPGLRDADYRQTVVVVVPIENVWMKSPVSGDFQPSHNPAKAKVPPSAGEMQ